MLNYGPAGKHRKITFNCSSKTRFIQSANTGKGRREINTFSKAPLFRNRGPGGLEDLTHSFNATSI